MQIHKINSQQNYNYKQFKIIATQPTFMQQYKVVSEAGNDFIHGLDLIVDMTKGRENAPLFSLASDIRNGGLWALKNVFSQLIRHNSNPKYASDSKTIIKKIDLIFKKKDDKVAQSLMFEGGCFKVVEILENDVRKIYPPYKDISNLHLVLTDNKGSSRNLKFEKLYNDKEKYLDVLNGEVSDMKGEIYSLSHKLKPDS